MDTQEFRTWIRQQSTTRLINHVQQHHTWKPSYVHFRGNNHFEMQLGMKQVHTLTNNWSDIGQHFSIFPDGLIVTGRQLNIAPACIKNRNTGGVCIENIGNFDIGGDQMRPEQSDAIIAVTAMLCTRFNIEIGDPGIVYHHWFDSSGNRTKTDPVKSCPGERFFGGNDEAAANANFFPKVRAYVQGVPPVILPKHQLAVAVQDQLPVRVAADPNARILRRLRLADEVRVAQVQGNWAQVIPDGWIFNSRLAYFRRAQIISNILNVRSEPRADSTKLDTFQKGVLLRVFEEKDGWGRIGPGSAWVKLEFTKWI